MPSGSISAKYAILMLIVIAFSTSAVANTDFQGCFQRLQQGEFGLQGAVDYTGNPVTSLEQASGLTYHACLSACGPGSESFDWVAFSQKFSAWVLPYLALVSQLPYGASDRLSNFEAIMMSVGSPMLAAYSLILQVTSNRWMVRRLGRSKRSGARFATFVLGGLQEVSLHLSGDENILPSLVLKENEKFWRTLAHGLEYSTSRWNLPAIFSMVFVAVSYVFTWINTARCDLNIEVTCSGQSFGSLWLCLIPIVLCNLQLSPKTDLKRIVKAFTNAQKHFHATYDSIARPCPHYSPFAIRTASVDPMDEDIVSPAPVCYYARIFQWFKLAREITDGFEASPPLASDMDKQLSQIRPKSEDGTLLLDVDRSRVGSYDLCFIIVRSIILALLLQWGTMGAAIFSHYMTPTKGLSCWSGSYILYGVLATVVWLLAFLSSIFAQIHSTSRSFVFRTLAINLRIVAKIVSGLNAVWIFMFSIFQFSSTYNTCYCNASVLGLGAKAYVVMAYTAAQMQVITVSYWTVGMLMAAGTACVFIAAFNILKQPLEMPHISLDEDQEEHTPVQTPQTPQTLQTLP